MYCHGCHGEYKVREYWEAGRRFMYCQRCYHWFARLERQAGRKPPAWAKLLHPIEIVSEQFALVLAVGKAAVSLTEKSEHVIGVLSLVPA